MLVVSFCLVFVLLASLIPEAQGKCRNLRFTSASIHGYRLNNHVIRTNGVMNEDYCELQCYMEPNCVSYNFNKREEANGQHKCDLNNTTYEHDGEHSGDLAKNESYIYRGAENACAGKPCQNNSTCQAGFTDRDYQCLCISGFTGHDCENVLDPVALYPLDGAHGIKEISNRVREGVASGVHTAPGPDGKPDGSYEFSGTVNSYIEFPSGGVLDVQNSMTMLCWLYPGGQDGPLFNYGKSHGGRWGVRLWVLDGQLSVRFIKRDYSWTQQLLHTSLKPEDGWKFVGASYDHANGHAKLWVDGKAVQTVNIGANLQLATQDNVTMGVLIGEIHGRHFKGKIAQMQVYNVALTQEQINLIKDRT